MKIFSLVPNLFALILFTLSSIPAQAFDPLGFSTAVGASVAAKVAGDELRETVDHAQSAAEALLEQGGQIAKERIEQIDKIILETGEKLIGKSEAAVLSILSKAKQDIEEIQNKIFNDLVKVIRTAECALIETQDQIINNSLGGRLPSWLLGKTRVISLPYPIEVSGILGTTKFTTQYEIDLTAGFQPAEVFVMIEKAYLKSIGNVKDDDSAFGIMSAYMNMSRLSRYTMCLYKGPSSSIPWVKKYTHYENLLSPWATQLNVRN